MSVKDSAGADLISSTAPAAPVAGEADAPAASPVRGRIAHHIAERLVTPRPDCLIWTAATDRGYGRVFVDGTAKRVHRVVWEMERGPIPEGLTIDHLCRVRACCNTAHMELVTQSENSRRAAPYRPADTHCRNGHKYTAANTSRKPNGTRRCLDCRKEQRRRAEARRRSAA